MRRVEAFRGLNRTATFQGVYEQVSNPLPSTSLYVSVDKRGSAAYCHMSAHVAVRSLASL